MNRRSLGTFYWGAVLIVIGGLLLARNFGVSLPIWNALTIYWPVLIIVWGVVKLVDHYRFRDLPDRRLFSGGEVALLLLLIFAGSAVTVGANISPDIGDFFGVGDLIDIWSITGNNYDYTEHAESEIAPGALVDIFNLYGNVEIEPSAGNRIVLDVKKTVRASSREEADRLAAEFTFSIKQAADGSVRIRSNRDENVEPDSRSQIGNQRERFKSSLTLQIPADTSLRLTNRFGATKIAGIHGDHDIRNSFGVVTLRAVTGATRIENRFGAVNVTDSTGDVAISTSFAAVHASNIQGALNIKGNNNSIEVNDVSGALTVETSFDDVRIRNALSLVNIKGRYGDIDIVLNAPPREDIRVESAFGDVRLRLPADSGFILDAHTKFGDVNSDFSGQFDRAGREKRSTGTIGNGGPRVTIDVSTGDIRLTKL